MAASNTDFYTQVGNPGTATTLAAPGHSIAGTTFNVVSTSNWPTTTGAIFAVDTFTLQTVNGVPNVAVRTPGSYTEWEGVVASSTQITGGTLLYGTDQNYSAGSSTRVYIPVASSRENRLVLGLLSAGLTQAGGMGAISPTSITSTGTVTAANFIQTGGSGSNGWNVGLPAPTSVTALGNHSYSVVLAGDQTAVVSPGMRLRTTRTVAAPAQCTSLNGSTQYYSKTSPAGMTFTDDFVAGAWVKLSSYPSVEAEFVSRYNGTSGWELKILANGTIHFTGRNASAANFSEVLSYQSVPLNKWVHIAAQLDMSSFTASTTTSYIMIDGVDVPASVARGGTNPTALVQAGNLEIGSENGGTNPFPGKIAQAFVFNAKVTQSTIQGYISQGLAGTETSLISAYSFNNSITDLNTTNANNLTANGSAVATNADSPFGGQADGTISGTLDYGEIVSVSFSTNTTVILRVMSGNTIPTSGGVSSAVYSSNLTPYGCPTISNKLVGILIGAAQLTSGNTDLNGWTTTVTIPTGVTEIRVDVTIHTASSVNNTQWLLGVLEGAIPVRTWMGYSANGSNAFTYTFTGIFSATAGAHTYKVNINPTGSNITTSAMNSAGTNVNELSFSKA